MSKKDDTVGMPAASRRGFFGTIAAAFGGAAAAKALPSPPATAAVTITLPTPVPPAMRYEVKQVPWPTSCGAFSAVLYGNYEDSLKVMDRKHIKIRTEPE